MKPNFKIVSAPPGEPSILWYGKSGNVYRNIVDAKKDKPEKAYKKPAVVVDAPKQVAKTNYLVYILIVALLVFITYKIIK